MSSFRKRFGPHAHIMRAAALEYPSLLKRLADAPDKTFHVYAIRLGALLAQHADADAHAVGHALSGGDLAALLAEAWGDVPAGALATLDRCGPAVHDAALYTDLKSVLADRASAPC